MGWDVKAWRMGGLLKVYLVNEISIAPITYKKRFILSHILCTEYVVALQI